MPSRNLQTKQKRPHKVLSVLAVLVLIGLVLAGLELTNVTHFFHSAPVSENGPTPSQKQEEAKVESQQKEHAINHPVQSTPSPTPAASNISLTAHEESNGMVT